MRIISGRFGSRKIETLPGSRTRPTSDRLRETLFNVLAAGDPEKLNGLVWLDAYAGSGAIGLEALSRGARMVYFLESSDDAAAMIRRNLSRLGIDDGFEILQRDAPAALRQLDAQGVTCDVCFLDPPYGHEEAYEECLGFLAQSSMLAPESRVIAEHGRRFDPGQRFGALERERRLRQGDSVLSFYRLR